MGILLTEVKIDEADKMNKRLKYLTWWHHYAFGRYMYRWMFSYN